MKLKDFKMCVQKAFSFNKRYFTEEEYKNIVKVINGFGNSEITGEISESDIEVVIKDI